MCGNNTLMARPRYLIRMTPSRNTRSTEWKHVFLFEKHDGNIFVNDLFPKMFPLVSACFYCVSACFHFYLFHIGNISSAPLNRAPTCFRGDFCFCVSSVTWSLVTLYPVRWRPPALASRAKSSITVENPLSGYGCLPSEIERTVASPNPAVFSLKRLLIISSYWLIVL
jgi:hypothetical protein